MIALRPLQELPQAPFLVAQRQDHELSPWRRKLTRLLTGTAPVMLNPNVIYNPSPKPGDVVDLALGHLKALERLTGTGEAVRVEGPPNVLALAYENFRCAQAQEAWATSCPPIRHSHTAVAGTPCPDSHSSMAWDCGVT